VIVRPSSVIIDMTVLGAAVTIDVTTPPSTSSIEVIVLGAAVRIDVTVRTAPLATEVTVWTASLATEVTVWTTPLATEVTVWTAPLATDVTVLVKGILIVTVTAGKDGGVMVICGKVIVTAGCVTVIVGRSVIAGMLTSRGFGEARTVEIHNAMERIEVVRKLDAMFN